MGRLEKLVKKHERGDLPRVDWLDRIAFRQIEKIHSEETEKSSEMYLYVDLPRFDFPVVYSEIEYPAPSLPFLATSTNVPNVVGTTTTPTYALSSQLDLFTVVDPEIARHNPVEAKHTRLHRSHRTGPLDRELRPEKGVRDDLNVVLNYPPTHVLTRREKDLVWKFRFYLTRDKRALTKFLKSVVWSDVGEVKQAVDTLLPLWCDIDFDDALELLGPADEFRNPRVRGFAVKQLDRADDEELVLYLLQLVQAIKFEPPQGSVSTSNVAASMRGSRHLRMMSTSGGSGVRGSIDGAVSLEDFLIERSIKNAVMGNYLYWYLQVEREDKAVAQLYLRVSQKFSNRLQETDRGRVIASQIARQNVFMTSLATFAKNLRLSKDARPKKIEKLKAALRDAKGPLCEINGNPIPLPLDARISVTGIDAEKSSVFKSNLFPLRLSFQTEDGQEYPAIFKNGDDMRQDQLVIQLFTLMDRLLRKEQLDLKLTPYKVLATGLVDGMVQYIPSRTLGDISSSHGGSLLNYLRSEHPDEGSLGTYGVAPNVLDNFVRSCAGYCVVTYLLGVGDRHLDNLMLSEDGHFFHVDFGYILGRDPKPFPPAVKVCKEMVDGMGGVSSPHYQRFQNLCYTAFISLRKSSNLIINLVALMVEANIPDIKLEPDKAVMKVQEKFRLDLSDEEAIKHFESLLNETSYISVVLDRLHAVAQYWRA